ncbi:MAG TPA: response regulator [Dongiaceae bacterium]|nr:response regulator [Dongiaceae bacterium]
MDPVKASHRILIVDDEPEVRDSLKTMLESYGHAVSEAGSTAEALIAIEAIRPDIVLTDVFLGEGDAFALLEALRANEENIPVIAMSGGGSAPDGTDALSFAEQLGAAAIIDKPFRVKDLLAMIDRTIAEAAG